jgi:CRP-like cAMP-binding protein
MIGKEGIVGLSVFLGEEITPHRYVAQLPSAALALDVDIFKEAAERGGELQVLLQRFAQTFISQISQSTLCICFHNSEQRLARWLLLSQDYANSDEFPLTHEFVAQMLGIRRTGVTEAANLFKGANLIKYAYGKVSILNRQKLEAVSCSCYRIVTAQRKRLLGL